MNFKLPRSVIQCSYFYVGARATLHSVLLMVHVRSSSSHQEYCAEIFCCSPPKKECWQIN